MNPSPPNWQDPAQISFPLTTTKQSGFLALSQPLKLKEVQMRKSRALLSTCENFDRLAARFGQHFSSLQFLKKMYFWTSLLSTVHLNSLEGEHLEQQSVEEK